MCFHLLHTLVIFISAEKLGLRVRARASFPATPWPSHGEYALQRGQELTDKT